MLALGGWFKSSACVAHGEEAWLSPPLGDLDQAEACAALEQTASALCGMLDRAPQAVAHDLHPDFFSTRLALEIADRLGVPAVGVQHHHAHIAAICAEYGIDDPVLGLALDGVGLGTDGGAWGGELLLVEGAESLRLGHLQHLALPGGDRAAREPWRMAAAALHRLGRGDEIERRFARQPAAKKLDGLLQRSLNCPPTSSAGRLFDAAAGLLGLCPVQIYEAEAAILLEILAQQHGPVDPLPQGYTLHGGVLDFLPLLDVLADCGDAAYGAALFHATIAAGLAEWAACGASRHEIDIVACGGGCFLNGLLSHDLTARLRGYGLSVLTALQLPPGDQSLALGQAWVARARLQKVF